MGGSRTDHQPQRVGRKAEEVGRSGVKTHTARLQKLKEAAVLPVLLCLWGFVQFVNSVIVSLSQLSSNMRYNNVVV